ncbi:hypothetical protein F5148DRAFT_1152027 [Russula earlei]|uniref:Uncharacterized protein n=1 Tax=Russula earlei TaxID=71964 RepID=A0ACC0TYL0_9AGAM|nr:hypothetical protein F5148DRAFT_1152027 [Russula earlei]
MAMKTLLLLCKHKLGLDLTVCMYDAAVKKFMSGHLIHLHGQAFLSASYTAKVADKSWPDEALHLSAAMLHCGSCSIIGKMWKMVGMDGRHMCNCVVLSHLSRSSPPPHPHPLLMFTMQSLLKYDDFVKINTQASYIPASPV